MKDIEELINFGLINFDKPAGPSKNFVFRGRFAGGWWDASLVGRLTPSGSLGNFCYFAGGNYERY